MNKTIGYTTGVFDLFHIGHLNILRKAKQECDYLIVAVTSDDEVMRVKGFKPFIPLEERLEIIKSIKYVDCAVVEESTDKIKAWEKFKFDKLFKGSDWKKSPEFVRYEKYFSDKEVDIVFFDYTKSTSSTKLRKVINGVINEN